MDILQVEGITERTPPYIARGQKFLILSDIHIPYHNKLAVNTALNYLPEVDTLILNGDIIDFYQLSRFVKDPTRKGVKHELEITREFLTNLRKHFKGEILYKLGNHEDRLTTYLFTKASELNGIVTLQNQLGFEELNIKQIDSNQFIRIGSLFLLHGHEIQATSALVNIARSKYLKAKENLLFGHSHQTQDYFDKSIDDNIKGAWSMGCLCDLNPRYATVNNWNHGFATVEKINRMDFNVKNYKIIKGKVF